MKKLETDKELIDLIKDTLDSYEEKYILGSWESFVRRKKRRKKLIFWFTFTGIAATLLTGWIGFRVIQSGSFGTNSDLHQQNISSLENSSDRETDKEPILIQKAPVITAGTIIKMSPGIYKTRRNITESQAGYKTDTDNLNEPDLIGFVPDDGTESDKTFYTAKLSIDNLSPGIIKSGYTSQRKIAAPGNLFAKIQEPDAQADKLPSGNNGIEVITENDLQGKLQMHKFRFGINLSPGITSTNTLSSVSFSGGFNAEYALSGKFQVSAGLQLERMKVVTERSDNPAWIPPGQTRADLVDLDLPINIKWKFLERRSSCYYLASGISSVVYLREKYISTSYTQKMVQTVEMTEGGRSMSYQLENVKTTDQKTEAPLSTFDFAGRINIIFGLERQLSSRIFIHMEPYMKIPLSELASQNLRFTTSGITCKISF